MLYGSVIPVDGRLAIGRLDTAVHVCEYLLFAWLLARATQAGPIRERERLLLIWIYVTGYGLLIELVQGLVPWRSADVLDAGANAVGAALGVLVSVRWPRALGPSRGGQEAPGPP